MRKSELRSLTMRYYTTRQNNSEDNLTPRVQGTSKERDKRGFWDSHRTAVVIGRWVVVFLLILGMQFVSIASRYPLEVHAEVDSPQPGAEISPPQPRYGEPVPAGGDGVTGGQPGQSSSPGATSGTGQSGATGSSSGGFMSVVADSPTAVGFAVNAVQGIAPTFGQTSAVVGGIIGSALGGPIGGAIGGFLGFVVDVIDGLCGGCISSFFGFSPAPPDEGLTAEDADTAAEAEQGETGESSDSGPTGPGPGPGPDGPDGPGTPGPGDGPGDGSGSGDDGNDGSDGSGGPGSADGSADF